MSSSSGQGLSPRAGTEGIAGAATPDTTQVQGGFFAASCGVGSRGVPRRLARPRVKWPRAKHGRESVGLLARYGAGVKAIGRWGWNVLKSGAALAWTYIVNMPGRVWRLIKHLGSGIAGVASSLWAGLEARLHLDFKGLGKLLLDGFLSGAVWVVAPDRPSSSMSRASERSADLLSQIIKVNTRSLSSGESSEAHKVFKSSISYWKVRIDEYSLISTIGAWFKGGSGLGVTLFHTVNFNHKITAAAGSSTCAGWRTS